MRRATSGTSASVFAERDPRLIAAFLAIAGALARPGAARADDVDACASASEKGQELRDQAKLTAARELFVTCAAERCPAVVRKDCTTWLAEVDEALPSVAIHARDAAGKDLTDVRVTVDGATFAERLDGRAQALDPGAHTFVFEAAGLPKVTQKLLLREREKGRLVDVVLGRTEPPAPEKRPFSIPSAAWILGGASLVGFGVLAGFGLSAKTAVDDMRTSCAPGCSPGRVDDARRDMILANVGLGAGVLALGAAAIVVLVENRSPAPHGAPLGPAGPALRVSVQLVPSGISLTGSF